MTRVVVLADTHLPRRGKRLPAPVLEALARADLIIHLGDFTEPALVDELGAMGPLQAVHGNGDAPEIKSMFPPQRRLEVSGHALSLIHGDIGGPTALAAARREEGVDAVLFGHSHRAWMSTERGILLFNPGSPTDGRWSKARSFGILDIGETVRGEIVPLD